jgi:hypothetical protein
MNVPSADAMANAGIYDVPKEDPWISRVADRLEDSSELEETTFSPEWKSKTSSYRAILAPLERKLAKGNLKRFAIDDDTAFQNLLKEAVSDVVYLASPASMYALQPFRTVKDMLEVFVLFGSGADAFGRFCFWLKFKKHVPDVAWFRIAVLTYLLSYVDDGHNKLRNKKKTAQQGGYMSLPAQ